MVGYGRVWYGMVWYGMLCYDTIVFYGMVWFPAVQFGAVKVGLYKSTALSIQSKDFQYLSYADTANVKEPKRTFDLRER